ncbi:MAG: MarR family transcriptional regulator [Nitrososphaera sp.]
MIKYGMVEPLSEEARSFLAFIRDHPGVEAKHLGTQFHIDWTRVYVVIKELQDRALIDVRSSWVDKNQVLQFFPKI